MKKRFILFNFFYFLFATLNFAQVSMTNTTADAILKGNYNVNDYKPSVVIDDKDDIINAMISKVSADSLKSYLVKMETFGNRNTGSDTVSSTRGIGACRRWVRSKFQEFSARNESRLVVSYLAFTANICGMNEHRNVVGVLPGLDPNAEEIVIVQAHMDSRCEDRCDTSCYAPGMDDNASGTALVVELARVMSQFAFDRTIVFTTLTGEEQGLKGGNAMAIYLFLNDIKLLACLNNDVVGGVECGPRSSPPSCAPAGAIDSMNTRIFSYSSQNDTNFTSIHKQLARYLKLQQLEELNPALGLQHDLKLQIYEDRSGRGGDHIPYRQRDMRAIRYTSSHEHGDGAGNAPDRQHTTTDVLGYDLSVPPDGILDTFLIDFNYLRRNTLSNGVNLALLAKSPPIPDPVYETYDFGNILGIRFINGDTLYSHRIGLRKMNSTDLYFDTILSFDEHYIEVNKLQPGGEVQIHPMNVRDEIESIPEVHRNEKYLTTLSLQDELECHRLFPNPSSGDVRLDWRCGLQAEKIDVLVYDLNGQLVKDLGYVNVAPNTEVNLDLNGLPKGVYKVLIVINYDETKYENLIID